MALDHTSFEYETFIEAVANGRTEEVEQQLIEHPEFLDLPNSCGRTPLHHAAWNGHDSTVELLLNRGSAALDSVDGFEWTPLFLATLLRNYSTMTILKAVGAIISDNYLWDRKKIKKLQAPIPEDEILEIRYRIFFSRPLLSALL